MLLHKGLIFKPEDTDDDDANSPMEDVALKQKQAAEGMKDTARKVQDIGNATETSEVFFEYQVDEAALEKFREDKELKELPFQVHDKMH